MSVAYCRAQRAVNNFRTVNRARAGPAGGRPGPRGGRRRGPRKAAPFGGGAAPRPASPALPGAPSGGGGAGGSRGERSESRNAAIDHTTRPGGRLSRRGRARGRPRRDSPPPFSPDLPMSEQQSNAAQPQIYPGGAGGDHAPGGPQAPAALGGGYLIGLAEPPPIEVLALPPAPPWREFNSGDPRAPPSKGQHRPPRAGAAAGGRPTAPKAEPKSGKATAHDGTGERGAAPRRKGDNVPRGRCNAPSGRASVR